jgi:hypothetical protein
MNNLQIAPPQLIPLIPSQKPQPPTSHHPAIKLQLMIAAHQNKKVWTIQPTHLSSRTILQPTKTWQITLHRMIKINKLILQMESKHKKTLLILKMWRVIALFKTILRTKMILVFLKTLLIILIAVLILKIKPNKMIKILQTQTIKPKILVKQPQTAHKTIQKMQTTIQLRLRTTAQTSSQPILQGMVKLKIRQSMKTKLIPLWIKQIIMLLNRIKLILIILLGKTKLRLIIKLFRRTKPILTILQMDKTQQIQTIHRLKATKPKETTL